jgi:hypothetical protein
MTPLVLLKPNGVDLTREYSSKVPSFETSHSRTI